jgi:hypothetical protein
MSCRWKNRACVLAKAGRKCSCKPKHAVFSKRCADEIQAGMDWDQLVLHYEQDLLEEKPGPLVPNFLRRKPSPP